MNKPESPNNPQLNDAEIPSSERALQIREYEEDLKRMMQEHERFSRQIRRKNRIWTLTILVILVMVLMVLVFSVGGWKMIYEKPAETKVFLFACLGCLLMGFMIARWVERLEYHLLENEAKFLREKKKIEDKYAELRQEMVSVEKDADHRARNRETPQP
jgi:antibiotic biosynthesis monooxygenase (ABM) superfamily enzyme